MVFGVRQSARCGYRAIMLVVRETDDMKQSCVGIVAFTYLERSEAARAKKASAPYPRP